MIELMLAAIPAEVEAVKDPGFMEWVRNALIFLALVAFTFERLEKIRGRNRPSAVRVDGEVVTSAKVPLATKPQLDELESRFEGFVTQHLPEHRAAVEAGKVRVAGLARDIEARIDATQAAIVKKMEEGHSELSRQLSAALQLTARHDAVIPQLDARLREIAETQHEDVRRLHARVDDALRAVTTHPTRPK